MNKKRKKKINTICLMTYLPWELNTLFLQICKKMKHNVKEMCVCVLFEFRECRGWRSTANCILSQTLRGWRVEAAVLHQTRVSFSLAVYKWCYQKSEIKPCRCQQAQGEYLTLSQRFTSMLTPSGIFNLRSTKDPPSALPLSLGKVQYFLF